MDSTGPTHHPVLPGGLFPLRGLHPRVRLQTPLERCTGGSPAGGAHRRAHRESNTGVHILITPTCVTTLARCFRRSDTCPTSSSRGLPAARAPTRRRTNSWSANRTRSRPTPSAGTTTATPEPSEPGRHWAERTCDPYRGAGWGSGPDSSLFSMIFPNLSAGERSENVI